MSLFVANRSAHTTTTLSHGGLLERLAPSPHLSVKSGPVLSLAPRNASEWHLTERTHRIIHAGSFPPADAFVVLGLTVSDVVAELFAANTVIALQRFVALCVATRVIRGEVTDGIYPPALLAARNLIQTHGDALHSRTLTVAQYQSIIPGLHLPGDPTRIVLKGLGQELLVAPSNGVPDGFLERAPIEHTARGHYIGLPVTDFYARISGAQEPRYRAPNAAWVQWHSLVSRVSEFRDRPLPVPKPVGSVYLVQDAGTTRVKIGYSEKPHVRLRTLQSGASHTLRVLGTIPARGKATERALHAVFESKRRHGEWFELSMSDVRNILDPDWRVASGISA